MNVRDRGGLPDRRTFLALGVGALSVAGVPWVAGRRAALVRRRIPVMGTVGEVAVRHRDAGWAQRAVDAAFAELRRVDRTMSRFRPDSDVGRVNAAGADVVAVSEDTAEVLAAALAWARASRHRFDPCLGRLTAGGGRPPAGAAALEVERTGTVPRVRLHHPDAAVDLGGIAKGYAVDLAARALRERGVFHALVNAGGDLVALGVDARGEPWRVGVRSPERPDRVVHTLLVSEGAVATSGTYFRGAHILDPYTGAPVRTTVRSLTVEASTCVDADAAATAVFGAEAREARRVLALGGGGTRVVHTL